MHKNFKAICINLGAYDMLNDLAVVNKRSLSQMCSLIIKAHFDKYIDDKKNGR